MLKSLTITAALSLSASSARAVDYHFVRTLQPDETTKWGLDVANIAGMGILFMPQINGKEDLAVRVRMYRPVEGDFEVFQEETAEVGTPFPAQPGTYQYLLNLPRQVLLKPGKYLVRVDCFDISDDKPALLGSDSVFFTAVEAKPKNADPQRPLRPAPIARRPTRGFDMHFARISEPIDIERRGAVVEKITVGGFVFLPDLEAKDDLIVRVRLYRPVDGELDVADEAIAKVDAGWPGHPGTYRFTCGLKPAQPVKPGKYLLRVDCLNKRDREPTLWATALEFLTIAAATE